MAGVHEPVGNSVHKVEVGSLNNIFCKLSFSPITIATVNATSNNVSHQQSYQKKHAIF